MKKGRVLAIDYGSKKVGIATGDFENRIASPKAVIRNEGIKKLLVEILAFIEEYGVKFVIVGLPLNVEDGHIENRIMTDVRYFVSKLRAVSEGEFEVVLEDERLSSFEAGQLMDELETQGLEKLGKDAYSAQIILQRFFDRMG